MKRTGLLSVVLAAVVIGCGGPDPVPEKPTWLDDVEPILRANCFHCHGASAEAKNGTKRWDVYDLKADGYKFLMLTLDPLLHTSAKDNFIIINAFAKLGTMPPAPATRLSAQDLQVLEKWQANGFAFGTRAKNARPVAKLAGAPVRAGAVVKVALDITDGDGDQVVGRLSVPLAMKDLELWRSGRHIIEIPSAACPKGTAIGMKATLSDGIDTVSILAPVDPDLTFKCP